MNTAYDYDLVVIGSGPAGEKGAAQAAYFGKKVVLVERNSYLGGAGLNTGTVPSKTLRETALYFSGLRQRGLYGIDYSLKDNLSVSDFMYRKSIVVENQWSLIRRNLERHHIEVIAGIASLKDAHTVQVRRPDGSEVNLTTDTVLIATGSSPFHPPEVPFDHHVIYDSDSILQMSHIPQNMIIVGGGVIGSEYASIFTALGVQVTLVDSRDRLLPFVDREIAERLQQQLEGLGLRFIFNDRVVNIKVSNNRVDLSLKGGEQLTGDIALFAAGRQSNVQELGLENLGVKMGERGLILVNEKYQTSVPNIYAAGDVIGFPALASTSMEQARVAMVHAFNLRYKEQVSPILPLAVYTIPEISMVGLSEDECQKKNIPYLAGRAYYENNARGQIIGDLSGLLKLVFSPNDKKLLGVHLIGELASELVHIGAQIIAAAGTIDAFI
ncbi:MAG: Si-specific NAD(P)(+) transhydrogenase, partial [bacterium]